MFKYLLLTALLYFISYLYYVKVSHGLGHKAEFLQLRRFLPCALLAVAPAATAQIQLTNSCWYILDNHLPFIILEHLSQKFH